MVVINVSIGSRISKLRKKHNFTQEEFAKKVGISRAALSHYEKDRREPDYNTLQKIADFFEVTTDYLLGRTDKPNSINGETSDYEFDAIREINMLLKKYGIESSGFFDIERWKAMGPEEIKQLESYFKFISEEAKKKNQEQE